MRHVDAQNEFGTLAAESDADAVLENQLVLWSACT